jgi:hypothetical protein
MRKIIICSQKTRELLINNAIKQLMVKYNISENTAILMLYYSDIFQSIEWRN